MAPAQGTVLVPLDEHTHAIATTAAREVLSEHMRTCPIVAEFRRMHTDMYGVDGEKDEHPGVLGNVHSLMESRNHLRLGLAGAWALITGTILSMLPNWFHK